MIKIKEKDYNVEVRFRHVLPYQWEKYAKAGQVWIENETGVQVDKLHGLTACTVLYDDKANGSRQIVAFATCSKLDPFSRKVGRKIALARALQPLDKSVRTVVWKEYLNR
jgi:hypothetical protein